MRGTAAFEIGGSASALPFGFLLMSLRGRNWYEEEDDILEARLIPRDSHDAYIDDSLNLTVPCAILEASSIKPP